MMEIHGLDSEMIDVAAYTQKAFSDAAEMAKVLNDTQHTNEYKEKAARLAQIINNDFWVEEHGSYADFIGTVGQARVLINDAIHRADSLGKPWAVKELRNTLTSLEGLNENEKRPFVVHHNWVVNTPLETGVADSAKAVRALETASRFTNPFGMYVTGIDRDEQAGQDAGTFKTNKKIFSYIGAVMTLPTGVQAVAANNYGRPDEALDYLKRMSRSFSYAFPGSMYEVSPDYGMIVQAWNIYSFAVPVVEQFFGIRPDGAGNEISISPSMPSTWGDVALENVPVLDGDLSLKYIENEQQIEITILYTGSANVVFSLPSRQIQEWRLNNELIQPQKINGLAQVNLSTGNNSLVLLK